MLKQKHLGSPHPHPISCTLGSLLIQHSWLVWHSFLCILWTSEETAPGTFVCSQEPVSHSPDFEVFYNLLHVPQFSVQSASFSCDAIQLPTEVIDIRIEERLQVLSDCPGALLLQEIPLGLQDLVLLFQEAYLQGNRENEPHLRGWGGRTRHTC